MGEKNNLVGVTSLRGIACLLVIVAHSIIYTKSLTQLSNIDVNYYLMFSGAFGVDIFFVLSGYILSYATEISTKNSIDFVRGRFVRVFPAYIVVLLIATVLAFFKGKIDSYISMPEQYIYELTLTSNIFKPINLKSLVGVSWTLTYEFLFYFSLLISYGKSIENKILTSFIFFSLIIFVSRAMNVDSYFFKNTIMYEFIIGMLCYKVQKDFSKINISILKYGWFVFAFIYAFIIKLNWIGFEVKDVEYRFIILGIPAAILLLIFSGFKKSPEFILFMGKISYSTYLIHFVVSIPFIGFFVNVFRFNLHGTVSEFIFISTLGVFLSVFSGSIFYNFVEKRFK